ncbi:hypothetical protein NEUTE2DRAFT_122965 [Neurospora tetrasperma FGSC 2509]|nr:hypothetical protein NEUTE2DRAFT_122965 [Neurospora tetrasperma FGSC 2509]
MSFPFFSLGFAPRSLTFPTSNVVAIAIASLAALSVKLLLNSVAPPQADDDHECYPADHKTAQDAELSKNSTSATSTDNGTADSMTDNKASDFTEVVTAPKDIKLNKDVEISDDNKVIQGADSTATTDDTEIDIDTKGLCFSQHDDIQEIPIHATPILTEKDLALNSSNGVRSYHHSFPAIDIVEVVEVPFKQLSVRSYHHSMPDMEIIEVVDIPSVQATIIASPILSDQAAMPIDEEDSIISSDAAPNMKAEEAILHHARKESTATNFSTESEQTANTESPSTVPGTPDTDYSVLKVSDASEVTPICARKLEEVNVLTPTAVATTTPIDHTRSTWYDFSHLSPEELNNLDTVIVIDRPDNGVSYAQLSCGFWYRMDKEDNPVMMTQEEYEDLLAWFASFKKEKENTKISIPAVIVTDEEGNESPAEEIEYPVLDVIEVNQLTPFTNKEAEQTQTQAKPTTSTIVERIPSKWYNLTPMSSEESVDLETATVIDRPDNGIAYVQPLGGLWYRLDEADNALMMTQEEYEDLLAWFDSFKGVKQEVKLPPPVVLVTDEDGNEFLAEEDETKFTHNEHPNRPECGTKHVLLANGEWHYLNEDATTANPMTEDDYEEFVFWLHEKQAEEDERLDPEDKIPDQNTKGIELFAYADTIQDANDTNNAQEVSDELEQLGEAEYIGTNWNVVGIFDHPDGDKQFAMGSDNQVYWLIDGMFCLLDEDELDRFNRWRDGDKSALYGPMKQLESPHGKKSEQKWAMSDLGAIIEEDEEEAEKAAEEYVPKKWNNWGLYTIEEEEEQYEEEYSVW